jgi:hypothetical protein
LCNQAALCREWGVMNIPAKPFFLTVALVLAALPVQAAPTVVELFQSQGCSSCPPAIANVNSLADRPDLLALSFSVTYWDRLGWKDTFARPEFTSRQYAYGRIFGDGPYTPEVVINGRTDFVGANRNQLLAAIGKAVPLQGPAITVSGRQVTVAAAAAAAADVWLVRYDPRVLNVDIGAGENSGLLLPHRNIVRALVRLGAWSGPAQSYAIPTGGDPVWRTAILVQARNSGPILSAAKL